MEFIALFKLVQADSSIRVVVLWGGPESRAFTSGLDLFEISGFPGTRPDSDPAREALGFLSMVKGLQDAFTAIETCNKPVIVGVHGACIGAGAYLDLFG